MRNNLVIQYKKRFVGGFSIKTKRVWYVAQIEAAKTFNATTVNKFIADHANKGKSFESEFVEIHHVEKQKIHEKPRK